ncbi:MAG: hypothetical protein K6B43_14220 [Treponema sp.]|nr:hypothetical protein [Treponema sp.]
MISQKVQFAFLSFRTRFGIHGSVFDFCKTLLEDIEIFRVAAAEDGKFNNLKIVFPY